MATNDTEQPPVSVGSRLVAKARIVLAKKQAEHNFAQFLKEAGPQAEYQTKTVYSNVKLIEVAKILEDKDFVNFRSIIDPVKLSELQGSIELEGLRVPIVVVATYPQGYYFMRAGFRRILAVRNLGWTEIPAIVLPYDTPKSEEYWTNILENTAREKLSAYELANAAQMMRNRFGVTGSVFAQKSSHSPDYIYKLLSCIDRLPGEVLQSWQRGDRVPFEIYFKLSTMTPLEAIRNLRLWMGQHRIDNAVEKAEAALRKLQSRHSTTDKLLTVRGIERTQRLLMAIKVSKLPDTTKEICKEVVEYCQGCRRRVNGIVNDRQHVPDNEFEIPKLDAFDLGISTLMLPTASVEMAANQRKMENDFHEINTPENLKGQP